MSTTFTIEDFERDPDKILCAAESGPVFITDGNKPVLVVLTIEDYKRLTGRRLLLPPEDDHEPPKARILLRPVNSD